MALVTYYSLYAVLYLLGTVMLTSLVYALVRTYNEREGTLGGSDVRDAEALVVP